MLSFDQALHTKAIIGARRRNNIYGEVSDYIATPFLSMGGDGIIYNPDDTGVVSLIGRSRDKLYLIKLLYQEDRLSAKPTLDQETVDKLTTLSNGLGATPLYAIARSYSKRAKYYYINGSKVASV